MPRAKAACQEDHLADGSVVRRSVFLQSSVAVAGSMQRIGSRILFFRFGTGRDFVVFDLEPCRFACLDRDFEILVRSCGKNFENFTKNCKKVLFNRMEMG